MKLNLHPNYITGFIDGEGSFNITISRDENLQQVTVSSVRSTLHKKPTLLVCYIFSKILLAVELSRLTIKKPDGLKDQLSSIVDISRVLIPHLDKYPLLTSKYLSLLDIHLKKAINMMENKEHLTLQGIEKLKNMAGIPNEYQSDEEKWVFCQEHISTISPEWIQGFTDAEGCFYFYIGKPNIKGKESSTWYLQASLEIAQNTHSILFWLWNNKA